MFFGNKIFCHEIKQISLYNISMKSEYDLSDLSGRLRYAIDRLPGKQKELARRLGVKQQAVSYWVTGKGVPKDPHKVALALGVSLEWIISGKGQMETTERDLAIQKMIDDLERLNEEELSSIQTIVKNMASKT